MPFLPSVDRSVARALCLALLVLVALPASAEAITFHGKTSRGKRVTVTQPLGGAVTRATLTWRARCRSRGATVGNHTRFLSPMRFASEHRFVDGGTDVRRDGPYRLRFTLRISGIKRSPYLWTGTFRGHVAVMRGGRQVDSCRQRTIRWSASILRGHIEMAADPGAHIDSSGSWTTPADRIRMAWTGDHLVADVAAWTINIQAPHGHRLRPRRYAGAVLFRSYPQDKPGLEIYGNNLSCAQVTGEFTVQSVRYDRHGEMRSLRLSFEYQCDGRPEIVHGLLSYGP